MAATATLLVGTDSPVFPPILLVEAMAQLGGIASGQKEGMGGMLAALSRVELPPAVSPGSLVEVSVRIVRSFAPLFLVAGEARLGGDAIARAELTLAVQAG